MAVKTIWARRKTPPSSRGFGLIEVMISTLILVIGLVSLLGLFTHAVAVMHVAQEDLVAKQKAREALENVFSARNTQQVTFSMIQNASSGGIFVDGLQPLRQAGPDGLVGTVDDTTVEELILPGPDGLLGTADDEQRPLTNFQRQIQVSPVLRFDGSANPDLSEVTITIQYSTAKFLTRSYVVGSYVSRYR